MTHPRTLPTTITDDALPWVLIVINVVGIALGYGFTMILARNLTHREFEQYITAIATLGLLATLGEAGFGKYALRIVPVYLTLQSKHLLRGYVRYALVATLWLSLALVVAACLVEYSIRSGEDEYVVLVAITTLPFLALTGVVVDLLLSFGFATWGMFIGRIVVPLTSLALIILLVNLTTITPLQSVYCFSGGSVVALVAGLLLCARRMPRPGPDSAPPAPVADSWRAWTTASFSFMAFYFLLAWISRSTLFLASHLPYQQDQLALLAPAFETGCLILLLSKSTDKYFQPKLSRFLESTQWKPMLEMRRSRFRLIGFCVAAFLVMIVVFGKLILRIYGEDFVAGYGALCVIAAGSSVWTLYSLAPSILLYSGEQRLLTILLCLHAVLMVILMVALFPNFGALGAAVAYAVTVTSFALSSVFYAKARIGQLTSKADAVQQADRVARQP